MEGSAQVRVLREGPEGGVSPDGPVRSVQEAEVELSAGTWRELWHPEMLERLARAYWVYLTRISLGVLRVVYTPTSRSIVAFGRPLVLLRFRRPEYAISPRVGRVTWRIERGMLVSTAGRGTGYLQFTVILPHQEPSGDRIRVLVRAEVANFYPLIRGTGRFARFGAWLYSQTQLRLHVLIGHGFLRSLARLDLPPSPVGALAPPRPSSDPPTRSGRQ